MSSRNVYRYLACLIFAGVSVYLVLTGTLGGPVARWDVLVPSCAALLAAQVVAAQALRSLVRREGASLSLAEAFVAEYLWVFSKYLPGKAWPIAGTASYLLRRGTFDPATSLVMALRLQVLSLIAGLAVGVFWVWGSGVSGAVTAAAILMLALLVASMYTGLLEWGASWLQRILRRQAPAALSRFSLRKSGPALAWCLLFWMCTAAGFYWLSLAVGVKVTYVGAFAFPAAVTLGMFVVLVPASLGFREGILYGMLTIGGVDSASALSLAILSRWWTIAMEAVVFLVAVFLDRRLPPVAVARHEVADVASSTGSF